MENVAEHRGWFGRKKNKCGKGLGHRNGQGHKRRKMTCMPENSLVRVVLNQAYTIKSVDTSNDEMKNFLFTLGCYEGEIITVISAIANQYVIVVKDARYSIDTELAACIIVE